MRHIAASVRDRQPSETTPGEVVTTSRRAGLSAAAAALASGSGLLSHTLGVAGALLGSGVAAPGAAAASKLPPIADRAWEALGGGPPDLYFPPEFKGVWDVTSTLVKVWKQKHDCMKTFTDAEEADARTSAAAKLFVIVRVTLRTSAVNTTAAAAAAAAACTHG